MKKNKKFNKSIYSILLISLFLGNSIGTAQALFGSSVSIPSFEEITDKAEKRYGFDSNILRNAKRKGDYPQVEVFFDKTAPKEGEKVTATAMPKYFKNTGQQLYYTWFLFREGENDIEKAKQLAMGIVARGDFDPFFYKTNYFGPSDEDKDGYEASYGGDNGVGGKEVSFPGGNNNFESNHYINPISKQIVDTNEISRCYRHNFGLSNPSNYNLSVISKTGKDLIVECQHKFPKAPKGKKFPDPLNPGNTIECKDDYEVGDGEFEIEEELCWQLDPLNPDTDGDGFLDEADLAGLGQAQLTWNFQKGDRVGVVVEGTSMVPINESDNTLGVAITNQKINLDGTLSGINGNVSFEATDEMVAVDRKAQLNSYYKIAWAGLDVCDKEKVEGNDKRNLIKNDECEGGPDYGFTFLATKKVAQQAEEILKPTLVSNISKAQVNLDNLSYSDYITVKAVFDNETSIDPNFINYKWSVYLRDENGNVISNLIANNLVEGEIRQGLGASSIKFRGTNTQNFKGQVTGDNLHFSIGLEIVDSGKSKITSIEIPIVKNDIPIKLLNKDGTTVCDSDPYDKICPVYPGQTLYAVYDGGAIGKITGFSWELEGQKLLDKKKYYLPIPITVTSSRSSTVVPIVGSDMELQTVSLKAKKDNGDEITSERLLSVAKPMAKIVSSSVTPINVVGEDSENVFIFDPGMLLFEADMIPDYLNGNLNSEGVILNWYINGQLVDADFIAANPGNAVATSGQKLEFAVLEEDGDSINLTLEIIKEYTDAEKDCLKDAWGIGKIRDLNFKKSITLKKNSSYNSSTFVKGNSISVFMASTLNNAPEYFVFIIKTAIVFVLFWSLLYGFNYWFSQEVKLKKLND